MKTFFTGVFCFLILFLKGIFAQKLCGASRPEARERPAYQRWSRQDCRFRCRPHLRRGISRVVLLSCLVLFTLHLLLGFLV